MGKCWPRRYIHEVDHTAAHIQAKAVCPEVSDCEGGKGQEERKSEQGIVGDAGSGPGGGASSAGRVGSGRGGGGRLTFDDYLVEQLL